MICIPIKGPSPREVQEQLAQAMEYADVVELRLDCWSQIDTVFLNKLRRQFSIPMIFTLRSQAHGGHYAHSEEERLQTIKDLAAIKPEYFDLETHVPLRFIEEIVPNTKLILSYHNSAETPANLDAIYNEMIQIPAHFYKIAVLAQNSLDAMRLICWACKFNDNGKWIAISMGEHGQLSRILAPIIRSPITYAALNDDLKTAPGQLSAKTLINRYRHSSLRPPYPIYGLIGDPVDGSISDATHNHLMETLGINAVYVKIRVTPNELPDFLRYAKQLPFCGFSVTMPLKECILPYVDATDAQAAPIGALNTLVLENRQIHGFNTDGMGALNALERVLLVKGKRIVILGAGGAAKAIAYEAHRRGGLVTILNRNAEKARHIANALSCSAGSLELMATLAETGYDALINSTPCPLPISAEYILSNAVIMDIMTKPKDTLLLREASRKGCRIVYGYQMFLEQALGQFQLWFGNHKFIT
jgi:3-dehydroquinate dehydratase/shikimate dehydrogenase